MNYLITGFLLIGSFFLLGWVHHGEQTHIYKPGELTEQKESVPIIKVNTASLSSMSPKRYVINEKNYNNKQRECLALNIYHEARNQSINGQIAVGFVTLNRVKSERYPDTICEVVTQAEYSNGVIVLHKCQFSWWCNNKSNTPKNKTAWKQAKKTANIVLDTYGHTYDITKGSLWYHATYVKPSWITMFRKTVKIDDHIFYALK